VHPTAGQLLTGTQLNVGSLPGHSNDPYNDYLPDDYGQTSIPKTNEHTWGDGEGLPEYVNPVTAPEKAGELSAAQKDANLMMSNPALWEQQHRFDAARKTGGIIEDNMPTFGEREQLWNEQTGRGGDIKNAGISMSDNDILNAARLGYDPHKLDENDKPTISDEVDGSGRSGQSIMDNYNAYLAGVVPAANGFNGMVNSPTMFLAGESGSEHVSITPNGGSGGITVNIQNMNGSDNDLRKLKQTILEVIQQSSANRGRL
jgi:hypothetical protein